VGDASAVLNAQRQVAGDLGPLTLDDAAATRHLGRTLFVVVVAGTVLMAVYHLVLGHVFGLAYPWNTFLFRPSWRLSDYLTDWVTVRSFGQATPVRPSQLSYFNYVIPAPTTMAYSPLAHLLMRGIAALPAIGGLALEIAVFVGSVLAAAALVLKQAFTVLWQRWLAAMVLAAASYPVLFVIDRGNLDMIVFAVVFWGLFLYARGSYGAAVSLLGVAAALKYYPLILLILPLVDRRWRHALWGAAVAVGTTGAATIIIGFMTYGLSPFGVAHLAWSTLYGVHGGLTTWGFEGLTHRHSLWGLLDLAWIRAAGADAPRLVSLAYMAAAAAAIVALSVWLFQRAGPHGNGVELWRKAGLLVTCMILLPPLSADYTSVYVFVPLSLMFSAPALPRSGRIAAVFLALCLIPMDFVVIEPWVKHGANITPSCGDTKSSVIAYALFLAGALIAMLAGARRQTATRDRDITRGEMPTG
jgi:hypothetical protein